MDCDFDELYYATYRATLRAVLVLVPSPEDAHDITQEAYARALARWPAVSRLDNPAAWVRHVAVNAAIDAGRSDRSRRRAYRRFLGRRQPTAPVPDGAAVDVARALDALSPAHRQAIVLHYLLDLSVADIAGLTGRPPGTVKTNLSRGRAALARALRPLHEVSADA